MKREAVHHSKMKRLCRKLGIPLWQAAGLLEMIWHVTARQTPRGDIGKLSDEDIAIAIEYHEDERIMITALIESGWLDRDKTHRLIVHDWPDHAEDGVHLKIARSRQFFIRQSQNGETFFEPPKLSRLNAREREPLRKFYGYSESINETNSAHVVRTDSSNVRTDSSNVRTNGQSVGGPRLDLDPALTLTSFQPSTDLHEKSSASSSNGKRDDVEISFERQVCNALGFEQLTKSDQKFCAELQASGTTIDTVRSGIIVGRVRRTVHEKNTGVNDPVRSLRYFERTIAEAAQGMFEPSYVSYMEDWIRRHAK